MSPLAMASAHCTYATYASLSFFFFLRSAFLLKAHNPRTSSRKSCHSGNFRCCCCCSLLHCPRQLKSVSVCMHKHAPSKWVCRCGSWWGCGCMCVCSFLLIFMFYSSRQAENGQSATTIGGKKNAAPMKNQQERDRKLNKPITKCSYEMLTNIYKYTYNKYNNKIIIK